MARSDDYMSLINTARWRRLRRDTLTAHPLCQRCEEEGRVTAATEVHHVVPVEEAMGIAAMERLMFDPHNLRALCHDCHVRTHTELGRCGKAATKARNERQTRAAIEKLFG